MAVGSARRCDGEYYGAAVQDSDIDEREVAREKAQREHKLKMSRVRIYLIARRALKAIEENQKTPSLADSSVPIAAAIESRLEFVRATPLRLSKKNWLRIQYKKDGVEKREDVEIRESRDIHQLQIYRDLRYGDRGPPSRGMPKYEQEVQFIAEKELDRLGFGYESFLRHDPLFGKDMLRIYYQRDEREESVDVKIEDLDDIERLEECRAYREMEQGEHAQCVLL